MKDYRFIAFTFVCGMLSGIYFYALSLNKTNWVITMISIFMFIVWGMALFSYMKVEE